MKRFFFAALAAAALTASTATAADCGCPAQGQRRRPVRQFISQIANRNGPIVQAADHVVQAKPVRTAVGNLIEWPVLSLPLVGGCPGGRCPSR